MPPRPAVSDSPTPPLASNVFKLPHHRTQAHPVFQSFPEVAAHKVDYSEEFNKTQAVWLRNPSLEGFIRPVREGYPISPMMAIPREFQPLSPPDDYLQREVDIAKTRLETAKRCVVEIMELDVNGLQKVSNLLALSDNVLDCVNACRDLADSYPGGLNAFIHQCTIVMQNLNDKCGMLRITSKEHTVEQSTISSLLKTKVAKKPSVSTPSAPSRKMIYGVEDLEIVTHSLSELGLPGFTSISKTPKPPLRRGDAATIPVFIPGTFHSAPWQPGDKDSHIKLVPSQHTTLNPVYYRVNIRGTRPKHQTTQEKRLAAEKRNFVYYVSVGDLIRQPPHPPVETIDVLPGDLYIHLSDNATKLSIWQFVTPAETSAWINVTAGYFSNEGTLNHPLFPDVILHSYYTGRPGYITPSTQNGYHGSEKRSQKGVASLLSHSASTTQSISSTASAAAAPASRSTHASTGASRPTHANGAASRPTHANGAASRPTHVNAAVPPSRLTRSNAVASTSQSISTTAISVAPRLSSKAKGKGRMVVDEPDSF